MEVISYSCCTQTNTFTLLVNQHELVSVRAQRLHSDEMEKKRRGGVNWVEREREHREGEREGERECV